MVQATQHQNGSFVLQINANDLKPLCADLLKLKWDSHSPLAFLLEQRKTKAKKATKALKAVAADENAARALSILANPQIVLNTRLGGGSQPFVPSTACLAPSLDPEAVALISPSFEGSYLVQLFETPWRYLAFWLNLNASGAAEPVPNYMPPPLSLEAFVYVAHSIDCFRRVSLSDLLDHENHAAASIDPDAFGDTLGSALKSGDMRWLLPAFLRLTPGLDLSGFNEDGAHLAALGRLDFLVPAQTKNGRDTVLLFGEAGRAMGQEFARTWFGANGFEWAQATPKGLNVLHRGFLAPTALANHLCMVENGSANGLSINHQALTREALDAHFAKLLGRALEPALEEGQPERATHGSEQDETEAPAPSAPKFCPQCGGKMRTNAKFCSGCGKSVVLG
jgi:hypothetical protein